ncbi:MAG: DUF2589 domain-containing protein [Bacteroidales bacterium]|nr:DUF2589 domain-containing protein [Bacteroidales bacterium]MBQ2531469.1 DUF2589 domain-containing protein [Bacteroidales bacterium]
MSEPIDIAVLLRNVLSSAMDAEYQGYQRYLQILEELEDAGSVEFSYLDENGDRAALEIPIVTLVPLTMLHIEEAVFDFALNVKGNSEDAEDLKELERSGMLVSVTSNRAEDETTNLVVKVEMGQADISSGLITMLQKKNNSQTA